jgi:YD repeat-containing protein
MFKGPKKWDEFYQFEGEELLQASERPDYLMGPVSHVEYAYDTVGNRIRMAADGNATDYYYDGANRLVQAGGTSFLYDENGNLIEKTNEAGNTVKYDYTADNSCKGYTTPMVQAWSTNMMHSAAKSLVPKPIMTWTK